ncbi:autotransporter domain-containing protein [Fusobacterium mortiferum]|uniref:Autotransporter domain-containing protein n=1 Tax=Fusobacterium mortiferum TaxID=850 RepID=A0A414PM70_FUSMR|nr:autotransporter domain-containing protein [Fusobacterium mortiferum]RHF69685.1 autotransporter domain-containing protein [Fusobacterium mortiferum]
MLEEGNSIHILDMSGNGIVREYISNNIVNNGIIKGSTSAIAAQSISGAVINNGILAGREIFSNSYEIHMFETTNSILQEINLNTITPTTEINNGIYVKLESETSERNDGNATGNVKVDSSGNPIIEEIEIGTGGKVTLEDGSEKTIINGSTTGEKTISETILNKESDDKMDIYLSSSNLDTTSNVIINGTGIEKGALVVDSETTLTDSIVNGYNTGIYLEQGKFTVINTTINGGGLKNDVAVLKGDENGNIVEILETSVINGKVELGAGEDSLTIGNSVQINGDLDGGIGEDTLKLGDKELAKTESNLNIYHNINDFENIVFEGDTTLYETSSITGTTNIEIKSGTQVNLRVDSSVQDSDGTYKTHALFNFTSDQLIIKGDKDKITEEDFNEDNNFVVEENESEEGYDKVSILNLVTNGLGREAIIDLGNVKIEDTVWVKTDSIINQATKNETEDGTTITIEAEKDLFSINKEVAEEKYYLELNEIYKGIHSSNDDNFNVLNSIITGTLTDANKGDYTTITDKQQMATLLAYLKQIYTETPYSFSAEASRKSMNVFGDIVKENNFKAKDGEIITYGGLTHNNGEGTDKYYGKNYHGFDIGSADTKVDSKMTGAYGQIEKGISDSTAVGLMLGGNNNKVDIATSDLKGNSAYLGGYVKHDKGAFRGIAGIGIQYSDWDSHRNTMSDSYKENYSDRGLNIYAEGKYTKELTEGLFLEPKVGVSYDYIKQESINESKDKALALEVDGKDFDTLSGNVGLDLRKEIVTEKGKHNLTVGVNYTRILSGADEDNLTGNFGGNSFDILVPQKTKDNVSVGIKYDIELETGVMLGAKVSYDVPFKVSQDNHTHKNEGSWKVGVGIGYRFNTLNDLNPMNIISSSKKDSNITLRTKSYFEFDKAELNNNSKKVIEKFSEEINRDNLKGKIKIEGYTDNVGKSNYNEKLSLERATKVAEELKKQVKNSDTEYEILGKGATNPIGDNKTEVGRAKNRRVEIEFQEK